MGLTVAKGRDVGAEWNLDCDRVARSGSCVIPLNCSSQPCGFDANYWVNLRIEAHVTPQHFDPNDVALEPVALPAQRGFDHKTQKGTQLRRCGKDIAIHHAFELTANMLCVWKRR